MIDRWLQRPLDEDLRRPFVHILFGARQTGKSTLLSHLLPTPSLHYNLADPEERSRLLADPGAFRRECEALPDRTQPHVVFVDEAQAVPSVFDAVQVLYDRSRLRWKFVLCGSSARKLRQTGANLLPGGACCTACSRSSSRNVRLPPTRLPPHSYFPFRRPALATPFRPQVWKSVWRTAICRAWYCWTRPTGPGFCLPSQPCTWKRKSDGKRWCETGEGSSIFSAWPPANPATSSTTPTSPVRSACRSRRSNPTISSLRTCLSASTFRPTRAAQERPCSPRRASFCSTSASGTLPAVRAPASIWCAPTPGRYFEQWVVLELWKRLQYLGAGRLSFYRTRGGAEIDLMVERPDGAVVPVEVKWTQRPAPGDARHVEAFVREHSAATEGFVVCRCPRPMRLTAHVTAIPWFTL